METDGISYFSKLAGQSTIWSGSDNESNWIRHNKLPDKRRVLEKLGWTIDNITYEFNSHGFRSDEFVEDGVVFLGCSNTMGVGMDLERTWAYMVANALGLKRWNLGIAGGSNDTTFRMAHYWIPVLKPKYVLFLPPPMHRMELVTTDGIEQFMPSQITKYQEYYKDWLSMQVNASMNEKKNHYAIKQVCLDNNVPLFVNQYGPPEAEDDYGRDLIHRGPLWNNRIATQFLDMIDARPA